MEQNSKAREAKVVTVLTGRAMILISLRRRWMLTSDEVPDHGWRALS